MRFNVIHKCDILSENETLKNQLKGTELRNLKTELRLKILVQTGNLNSKFYLVLKFNTPFIKAVN